MARFTIRVELHRACTAEDYEKLHTAMEDEGFLRTITIGNTTYKLPTAEYSYTKSDRTKQEVLEAATRGARQTGKKHEILVTQSVGARLCAGLKVVAEKPLPKTVLIKFTSSK